jgi:HTH-type transcriptional regulator, sugar sensing transcriptional regulator
MEDSKNNLYKMDIYENLEKLNLTKNEIKVYLILIKIGSTMAGRIAKETMMDRSSVYNALKSLLEKGIISYVVEANRKVYSPANPNKIIDYFKEKEELAKLVIPQLEGLYKQTKEKENVTLFRGYKGVKTVFQDILREGNENLMFGSEGQFAHRMPYYAPQFVRQLEEKKIKVRSIVRQKRGEKPSLTSTIRIVPKEVRSNVVTNIFGNKIAIIIWSETPEAVLIDNKAAADSYRSYFEFMWENAKK